MIPASTGSGGVVVPELSDGVIVLSELAMVDVASMLAGEDDDIAWRLSGGRSTPGTIERHIRACAQDWRGDWYRPGAKLSWGLRDVATGTLAGTAEVQLASPDLARGQANLSYSVFPPWRGRGYAARAVTLMCGFLSRESVSTLAVLRIEPDNAPSIRVATACGFEPAAAATPGSAPAAAPTMLRFHRAV